MNNGAEAIERSLKSPVSGKVAVAAYLTAGFPTKEGFLTAARQIAPSVDVLEVGVPFSDPMADGPTIQRTSEIGLKNGVDLRWILESVGELDLNVPVVLMSYLNPLLSFGLRRLLDIAADKGISGFIIPDIPLEESEAISRACDKAGLALIQLVTPTTPTDRMTSLCRASKGFVYAVATTGITGGESASDEPLFEYLEAVKKVSDVPVLAGFGIRSAAQVDRVGAHADGVIVGSALLEAIEQGVAPDQFISGLTGRNA